MRRMAVQAIAPEQSKEDAKDRLIQAAIEEFALRGLQGARVEAIAKAAQANKQLVYYYFKSKDGLYTAALEQAILAASPDVEEASFENMPAEMAFRLYLDLMSTTLFSNKTVQRLLVDVNMQGGKHLENLDAVRSGVVDRVNILSNIISRGQAEGVFRPGLDINELYITITGIFSMRATNSYSVSHNMGVDLISEQGIERSRQWAIEHILHIAKAVYAAPNCV